MGNQSSAAIEWSSPTDYLMMRRKRNDDEEVFEEDDDDEHADMMAKQFEKSLTLSNIKMGSIANKKNSIK